MEPVATRAPADQPDDATQHPDPEVSGADPAAPVLRRGDVFIGWAALVVPALLIVAMLRRAADPIDDPDAWWHLRVGSLFWSGEFSVFRTGPLSTFATEPWVPRDWIPQLVASRVEAWFGLPGVAWLYGAALVVFVVVAYLAARRQADTLPAGLATALCVIGAWGSLTERPQLVSFVLLLVFVDAWLRTASDLRPRWWLIPVTWVWAASHGMWYLGVAIGGAVVVGLLLDRRIDLRGAVRLALVPFLSLVAAALTPAGPTLLLAVVQTGDKWQFVSEWQPPNFMTSAPAAAMLMVAVVAIIWARRRTRLPWSHALILLLATAMVLMAARTVAAGAAMVLPVLAMSLQQATYGRPPMPLARREGVTLGVVGVATLVVLALLVPQTSSVPGRVPVGLDDELSELPPGTAVLNAYELGGWLHWRHPELNTVIDGFTDGYTVEAIEEFTDAGRAAPGWEEYVEETTARHALLKEESPLAFALSDRLGWTTVGEDRGYVLLEEPTG